MELVFSDLAKKVLATIPQDMKSVFLMHLEKIHSPPPRNHRKQGIPCHVGNVTKHARIIYDISEDRTYILHCFTSHKEYEPWHSSCK